MSIRGIIAAGGASTPSLLQTIAGPQTATGGSTSSESAYILGSAPSGARSGIYNAQGLLTSASSSQTSAAQASIKARRTQALQSIAEKIDAGDTSGGRADATKLLSGSENDVTPLRLIARSYLADQNYKKAERNFARAAAFAPGNQQVTRELDSSRALQQNDSQTLALARRQIASPQTRENGLRLAFLVSQRSTDNADAYLVLADGFDAARKPSQVLGALQEALRYSDQQQVGEVTRRARKLAQEHPGAGISHNLLGRAFQKEGRFDEAIAELSKAAKLVPQNFAYTQDLATGYVARAQSALNRGDLIAARGDLQAAQSIDAFNPKLRDITARVAAERGEKALRSKQYTTALKELNTASAKAPADKSFRQRVATSYIGLAAYYEGQGADSTALTSYIKAYELDPTSTIARDNVAQLSHSQGLAAMTAGNYDSAVANLERAYRTHRAESSYATDLAKAYNARGLQRVALGEKTDAIEDFKKGFAVDPTNTSLGTNLASVL